MPDCTEKWNGITQCDSQERFHRSQVFGETSQNQAMEMWPAILSLNGGGLPSRRPRSYGNTAPLDNSPIKSDASRCITGVYNFSRKNSELCSLPGQPASTGKIGV